MRKEWIAMQFISLLVKLFLHSELWHFDASQMYFSLQQNKEEVFFKICITIINQNFKGIHLMLGSHSGIRAVEPFKDF